jgi:threonyl-tRNA synthetase
MVHRTVLGSMERFLASLLEHYGGNLPVWLAPVQTMIIPVADRHVEYARKLEAELRGQDIRAAVDARSERMNLKIRQAQLEKVPCMLVVGDKEMEGGDMAVRLRSGEQVKLSWQGFTDCLRQAIIERAPDLNPGA